MITNAIISRAVALQNPLGGALGGRAGLDAATRGGTGGGADVGSEAALSSNADDFWGKNT